MNEFEDLLEELKEKTGLEVAYFKESEAGGELLPKRPFDEALSDEEQGVTFFRFVFRGENYIGYLSGSGAAEYTYAVMLVKLIGATPAAAVPLSKNDYLKNILTGKEPSFAVEDFAEKYAIPDVPCYALCFHTAKHMDEVENVVMQAMTNSFDYIVHIDENNSALVKFDCNDSDYQSASDYAGFLAQSIFEETGERPIIGVGSGAENFSGIVLSYRQAATAVRMCKTFNSKGEVHTYKEYLLIKMLEEIPEVRKQEYMNELLNEEAKELLDDEDMLNTAEEFLLNSLNISETSRNLFMHRNTLMYRLDKIERITGMNIRKFSDAISFRVLTVLYKLLKQSKGD